MLVHLLLVVLALGLLFAGAESLVRGSSSLALRLGLSRLVVGLTVVAFGTSSPELLVSIKSAWVGQGDLAVGNVVGSNIFNIAVILGITAMVCPIPVHRQVIKIDAPIALGVAAVLPLLLIGGTLTRIEGLLLFAALVTYIAMNIRLARREAALGGGEEDLEVPGISGNRLFDAVLILVGLGLLVLGSQLLVDNAVVLAKAFRVSEAVIGLTIVAAGTSVPELATSLVAAARKQPDIAIGNVVGSNVFNILGILGVSTMVMPLSAPGISGFDIAAMLLFSALLIPLLHTGRTLHRVEGVLLLVLYSAYLYVLWPD